jgi:hypothetical protein
MISLQLQHISAMQAGSSSQSLVHDCMWLLSSQESPVIGGKTRVLAKAIYDDYRPTINLKGNGMM